MECQKERLRRLILVELGLELRGVSYDKQVASMIEIPVFNLMFFFEDSRVNYTRQDGPRTSQQTGLYLQIYFSW